MLIAEHVVNGCAAIMSLERDVGRGYNYWPRAIGSWLGKTPEGFANMFEAVSECFKVMGLPSDVQKAFDRTIKRLEKEGKLKSLRGVYYGYWLEHHLACGGSMAQASKLFNQN